MTKNDRKLQFLHCRVPAWAYITGKTGSVLILRYFENFFGIHFLHLNSLVIAAMLWIISLYSLPVHSWGGRGHASICEAAVHLVKSPQLKSYLLFKPHMMGHLCNMPDIYWKSLSSETRKLGDPTHYINSEKIGLKISEIPLDYKQIMTTYTGKPNKQNESQTLFSIPSEVGSNWWRADQFYRRAIEAAKDLKNHPEPKGYNEEQNDELPYNQSIYNMMVNLGLMGHFIGDNSQPFHNTSDYDGYNNLHGGIHAYYEEAVVAQFGPDLIAQIVKTAQSLKNPKFIEPKTVVEKMRALSELSLADLKAVYKADPIIKPSILKVEKGMSLKTPAVRKPADEGYKKMHKLILTELARSSYLLAHLWDEAYKAVGEPSLKAYKSYRYPYTTEFVKPDYQ